MERASVAAGFEVFVGAAGVGEGEIGTEGGDGSAAWAEAGEPLEEELRQFEGGELAGAELPGELVEGGEGELRGEEHGAAQGKSQKAKVKSDAGVVGGC